MPEKDAEDGENEENAQDGFADILADDLLVGDEAETVEVEPDIYPNDDEEGENLHDSDEEFFEPQTSDSIFVTPSVTPSVTPTVTPQRTPASTPSTSRAQSPQRPTSSNRAKRSSGSKSSSPKRRRRRRTISEQSELQNQLLGKLLRLMTRIEKFLKYFTS